jgi:T-complex protein 1 subunit beta
MRLVTARQLPTHDITTLLLLLLVSWAAADISKVQDDEVGDGTTSVVVLAGELLREAEQLVGQKVHPMTIIAGFREAEAVAKTELASAAFSNAGQPEAFRQDLLNIARTTLSSKILTADKVGAQAAREL